MKDSRKGEGVIFRVAKDPPRLTEEVLDRLADKNPFIDAVNNPTAFLTEIEAEMLAIIHEYNSLETGEREHSKFRLGGITGEHQFCLPNDMPARLSDAMKILGYVFDISIELRSKNPRAGWLILHAIKLGEYRAALGTRHLERFAEHGIKVDANRQKSLTVPDDVAKAFERGDSIRQIADSQGCKRGVVERFRKKWKTEKTSSNK